MKTIKKGRQQKGWSKEYICTGVGNGKGGCGAKLLVEEGDFFQTSSSAMGEVEYYVTFECQECRVWTDVTDYTGPDRYRLRHRVPASRRRRGAED